jgi:cell wall-associated NlpC family hydrolase
VSSADETQKASQLIERLLVDAPFRAAFRKDPVAACRHFGLDDLAAELAQGGGGGKAMHTLEVRESKSSLAGVVMAVAAEGIGVIELHGLVEHGLLHGNLRSAGEQALRGVNPMHPASSLHSELRGENPLSGASSNPVGAAERAETLAREQQAGGAPGSGAAAGAPGSSAAAGAPGSSAAAGAPAGAGAPGASSAAESAAANTASPGGAAAANAPAAGAAAAGSAAHGAAEASTATPGGGQSPAAPPTPSAPGAQPAAGGAAPAWPAEPAAAPAAPAAPEAVVGGAPGAVSPEAVGGAAGAASPEAVVGSAPAPGVAEAPGAGVVEPGAGAAPAAPGVAEAPSAGAASPEVVAGTPAVAPSVAEVPSAGVGAAVAEPGAVADPAAAGVYPAVAPSESAVASAQEYVGGGAAAEHASAATAEAATAAHDPYWASPKAHDAYEIAKSELGVPYLWGGTSPKTGFDCSGLVQYAYGRAGIHIPRVAAEQFDVGTPVGLHQLREGDLVFFKEPNGYIHHVGIYVGDYKFIQAPCTGQNVDYGDLREPYFAQQFAGGRRIVPLSMPAAPAAPAAPAVAAEPAAFQAEVQPAAGTAGAVPMAATGAATPGAVAEPVAAAPAVPGDAVVGSTPGVPVGAVAEPVAAAPAVPGDAVVGSTPGVATPEAVAEPAAATPVEPSVPVAAGAVPAAGQEISPGVHLYAAPLPVEPPPQPGTAVFKALQVQESSYLRHTVQFLQAVPVQSAEPAAGAVAPGVAVQAQDVVAGQSPVAGAAAMPGVVGATPGVPVEAAVPGQEAVVEQSASVPGQGGVVEQSASVPGQGGAVEQAASTPGQAPGVADAAGVVDAASSGTMPYPGDNAPKAEIAEWMGDLAAKHGLPRELPVMAALVESSLHNDNFGDRDSLGYFQMRTSIWDNGEYAGYPSDPELQVKWFINQALAVKSQMPDRHFGSNPANFGEWIDEIERPAEEYRGRYQLQLDAARELLGAG